MTLAETATPGAGRLRGIGWHAGPADQRREVGQLTAGRCASYFTFQAVAGDAAFRTAVAGADHRVTGTSTA